MWYAPHAPPLTFVSPCEKATFRSSILAASGAPVSTSFTWPLTEIGRSSTARIPGQTNAASSRALW